MAVPRDVRESLEKAGVKFDNQGNIIEDENETFIEINEDEVEEDDEVLDNSDEDEDDDNTDDSDDGDSEEDDEDDDEDEVEEEQEEEPEPKPKKRKQKAEKAEDDDLPKLTPKKAKKEESDPDEAISEIRKNLKTLIEKGEALKSNKKEDDGDDPHVLLSELRREAEEFRRMRFKAFADGVKARVNQNSYGAQFDDIINSAQWEEFLSKKAYGSKIGDLYRAAIQSQDTDSVVFFFDDFASKYLTRPSKEDKSVTKQDDLDDLAVPDKTKTSGKPKKRSKWDFEEADYSTKLDEAERGIITREEFIKFSDAFESALSKGRVKPSR